METEILRQPMGSDRRMKLRDLIYPGRWRGERETERERDRETDRERERERERDRVLGPLSAP